MLLGGILLHRPPFSTDPEHQWVRNSVHPTASYALFSGCCRNCTDIDICIHEQGHVPGHRQTHSKTLCTDSHPVSTLCEHLTDTRYAGVQTCLFSLNKSWKCEYLSASEQFSRSKGNYPGNAEAEVNGCLVPLSLPSPPVLVFTCHQISHVVMELIESSFAGAGIFHGRLLHERGV